MKRVILACWLLAAASSWSQAYFGAWVDDYVVKGDRGRAIEEYLRRLEPYGFSGAVLVAVGDTVLLHAAYGMAQVENGIPNTTRTVFCTGSVTKQFTATAIMLLSQDFLVTPEDPIDKFFNDVPADKKAITVHHLLTHTAGLQPSYGRDNDAISRDDFVRMVLAAPLICPVGARYEYSNAGYSLLAAIVEIVTGMGYEDFLRQKLFTPAWMKNTGLFLPLWYDSLVAHSQNADLNYVSPTDRPRECWNLMGNGGMLSTTADMYRWHRALFDGVILKRPTLAKLFTPYVKEYPDGDSYYGYGWVIQPSRTGDTVIWHNGGAMPQGWNCAVYYYKKADTRFIVFANRPMDGRLPADDIVANLSAIVFGDREVLFPPGVARVDLASFAPLAGDYRCETGQFRVVAQDNGLLVQPLGQDALDIVFPSPVAAQLRRFNDLSADFVGLMASGNFAEASTKYRFGLGSQGTTTLEQFWRSFDSLGTYREVTIIGTEGGPEARTHCRLVFANGAVECRFAWDPDGTCLGLGKA